MTTTNSDLASLFLEFTTHDLLQKYLPQLRQATGSLSNEQLWWRPNPASNSIGNLLMHLNGNVGQWLVASFQQREPQRDRPREFSARDGATAAELLDRLTATVEQAGETIARLTADELAATYTIQGKAVTGMEAIFHSISHFILHYGQIVYAVKALENRDLGFMSVTPTGQAV